MNPRHEGDWQTLLLAVGFVIALYGYVKVFHDVTQHRPIKYFGFAEVFGKIRNYRTGHYTIQIAHVVTDKNSLAVRLAQLAIYFFYAYAPQK